MCTGHSVLDSCFDKLLVQALRLRLVILTYRCPNSSLAGCVFFYRGMGHRRSTQPEVGTMMCRGKVKTADLMLTPLPSINVGAFPVCRMQLKREVIFNFCQYWKDNVVKIMPVPFLRLLLVPVLGWIDRRTKVNYLYQNGELSGPV